MKIRDRVKEFRRIKAKELRPNPKNWRAHGQKQRDAMKGVLAELGFAGAVLARQMPDGSYMLIDGHLRGESLPPDYEVPVLVLDVNEREADYLLATIDPLSALADQDDAKLVELLHGIDSDNAAVQEMIGELVKLPEEGGTGFGVGGGEKQIDPDMTYSVIVDFKSEKEQADLLVELEARGMTCRLMIS